MTLADLVARHARERPDAPAYVSPDERMTWREYHARATGLAGALHDLGLERPSASAHDLADALSDVLAGRPVAHARTQAIGCFIADFVP